MAKGPDKPISHERRAFFRQLFVKAVEKVEEAGRNFADRAKTGFHEPPAYKPPSYNYNTRDTDGYGHNPHQEVYGPPWPPPYGPPMPQRLKAELAEQTGRSVPRSG